MTRRAVGVAVVVLCLAACTTEAEDSDRGFGGNDAVCPRDPDSFTTLAGRTECPAIWSCEDLPLGKRCVAPGPDYPDSTQAWRCIDVDGHTACRGTSLPDGAAGDGWRCERTMESVVCHDDTPQYPDDASRLGWDCYYQDEFRVCDSLDGGPTQQVPPNFDVPEHDGSICFFPADDPAAAPLATGYYRFETLEGREAVHVSLVFSEGFVDNTYGVNASEGWRRHTFRDLVGSDHAEVGFQSADGVEVLRAKFDYITADDGMASGYDALGALGGDGGMITGDASAILDTTSSLDRNFNERGCVFTEDSPTPEQCPAWDARVIYEMWIARDAFGASGFGQPQLDFVHASPSKSDATEIVQPGPCP